MARPRSSMLPAIAIVSAAMLAGLAAIFAWVPTDCSEVVNGACSQGTVQRLFYIHVPSAWIAYLAFAIVLIASIAFLKTRSERWDHLAHASAEVGVVFTGITLVTGMIWAKPIWGTYWRWDPRLTLTLVLFLIYVGYLAFRRMATDPDRGAPIAAVIGIVGFATVPLVHFSVQWWRGQHPQPVVIDPEQGPQLPQEMLLTLLFMVVVFSLIYATLLTLRVRLERSRSELDRMEAAW